MLKQKKIILSIVFVFAALALLRVLVIKPAPKKQPSAKGSAEKVVVKVSAAERKDLEYVLSYVGNIKAKDEVNVFSKVTGKLSGYTVSEGDRVEKGQTIALIDRDETGLEYELARVESPISGIVGRTLLDKGANILTAANITQGTSLAIIVNMDEMTVKLNIPEQDIPYIQKGLAAQLKVDAYPADSFTGEVSKVSQVVDIATRTLPIEITLPNPEHRLKSGMFARINIAAGKHSNALVLPEDAIIQELGADYVFVLDGSIAKKRKITTGIRQNNHIEILEGLEDSRRVIVFGQQGLKDGAAVEIQGE